MLGRPKEKLQSWTPGNAETQQGGQLHEWELPRALNVGEESSEHLKWIDLEQVQHCADLFIHVTFHRTLNRERLGQG